MKCFFYYGDDSFSLLNEVAKIKLEFKKKHPQGNVVVISVSPDLSDTDLLMRLQEAIFSQGLFAPQSLIVVENLVSQAKQYPKTIEWLTHHIKSVTQTLILAETDKVDKRTAEFKIFKKAAESKEFSIPIGSDLTKWIKSRLKPAGFAIDKQALLRLTELLSPSEDETLYDLWQVNGELEKLMLYKWREKKITADDVALLVTPNISQNVFSLTNLFAEGKQREAVKLLEEMVGGGREQDIKGRSIQMIGALASQIRSLLLIKTVSGSQEQIAQVLNWKPGRVWITKRLAEKFEVAKLKAMLKDLHAIDRRLKTSDESPKLLLQLFLQKSKV